MDQAKTDPVGLALAAETLEAELRRFEEMAEALGSERLDSERNLRRAAQALVALRDTESRLADHLAALVAAVGTARARQEASAVTVQARAELIRQRSEALQDLVGRWEALGREARDVTELAQAAAAADANGGGRDATLAEVDARLTSLAELAQSLVHDAEGVDFEDLGRHAEGLRQQVLSARNKLRLARESG